MYQRQAQGLASLGRGPDTELVHMTPREVGALNTLARQNGLDGLPTNPQTGLPEAGIFDSLAPILIGATSAALAPATGGASIFANPFFVGGMSALGAGIASGFDAAEMAKWGLGVGGGAALGGGLKAAGKEATQAATLEAAKKSGTSVMPKVASTYGAEVGANVGNIGKAFTTEVGRKALPAAVGKAPFVAGIGSVAADQYSQMQDIEPYEFPKKEQPFYPEGGFMPPPRTSIDPFAGDPVAADFTEERLFFDPAPFTSPGYMPARAGGLVSLHEGGNVQAEMARNRYRQDQLQQISDSNRWTGGTLEEYKDWYNKKNPIQTMGMKDWGKMYEDAGGAEGTPATATSGSAFDSQMAQVTRDRRAGIFGGNQGLLPTTPSSGMLPTTPSSGSGPISSDSRIKDFLEQLLSGAARNNTESPQFLGGVNKLGSIQMQPRNQGGLLRGPGDGMSDDIMLPITGSRDIAAVSPDEFVVPADVVSGLGNGSTSAGAKQLYGMMDRVRNTRTGKTTQPRAIDAGKMMPA